TLFSGCQFGRKYQHKFHICSLLHLRLRVKENTVGADVARLSVLFSLWCSDARGNTRGDPFSRAAISVYSHIGPMAQLLYTNLKGKNHKGHEVAEGTSELDHSRYFMSFVVLRFSSKTRSPDASRALPEPQELAPSWEYSSREAWLRLRAAYPIFPSDSRPAREVRA